MAYILHIDTSADKGLTTISSNGKLIAQKINEDARNNAATINEDIDHVLKKADIALKDIDAIAVCSGPGSYTGLRIGVSTAKGICYALNRPLMMHSKLLLIAYDAWYSIKKKGGADSDYNLFYSIIPAREGEYFVSGYDKDFVEVLEPCHMLKDEVVLLNYSPETIVIGEVEEEISQMLEQKNTDVYTTLKSREASGDSWALYAHKQYESKTFVNLANSEPNYLKKVYTHKPKSSK